MGFARLAIEDLQSVQMQQAMLIGAGLQTALLPRSGMPAAGGLEGRPGRQGVFFQRGRHADQLARVPRLRSGR